MPVPVLNAVATQDDYTDALTVVFPLPRMAFAVNVFNNAVGYRLLYTLAGYTAGAWQTDTIEHHLVPSLTTFESPAHEGLPMGARFAGIMLRSWLRGQPGMVTVA